jgi:hypothetical protein
MSHQVELAGLDGANPLGFLAGLGTLRTLSESGTCGTVRLSWHAADAWVPCLTTERPSTADFVVDTIWEALSSHAALEPFALGEDLRVSSAVYRAYAWSAYRTASRRRRVVDFVAAFACDAVEAEGFVRDCELRTMSGAGHQHFLGFMRQLVQSTTREHLHAALFAPWIYADDGPSLRWDPHDDRRYALRWREPSRDKIQTVRGANRIAIEGLSLLPSMPVGNGLRTTGFAGHGAGDTFWTWPIWTAPINVDAVRSVVAHPMLLATRPDSDQLGKIGVAQVFRSQRLTVGKYRNFAPARPV